MTSTAHWLSARTRSTVDLALPGIQTMLHDRKSNTSLDLAIAENHLIRNELVEICKDIFQKKLRCENLSYPQGFGGDPELLEALAAFFNRYFSPHVPVEPAHVVAGPGATSCLTALLFGICNAGESVIIPGSYWSGFDFHMSLLPGVTIVNFPVAREDPSEETDEQNLMRCLEASIAACGAKEPRAVVLTNPHNPTGRCYTKPALESVAQFCESNGLHLIMDEVYGLSLLQSSSQETRFISSLSLDLPSLGVNPERVHVLWSTSKDFGSSGFRMGCIVSQANTAVCASVGMLTTTQTSTLASLITTVLLRHPKLPQLITLNQQRLTVAYIKITSWLSKHDIRYVETTGGVYVLARLAPLAESWAEEANLMTKLKAAGVVVATGRSFHLSESCKGWFRIIFAVAPDVLDKALGRMEEALGFGQKEANFRIERKKYFALNV